MYYFEYIPNGKIVIVRNLHEQTRAIKDITQRAYPFCAARFFVLLEKWRGYSPSFTKKTVLLNLKCTEK